MIDEPKKITQTNLSNTHLTIWKLNFETNYSMSNLCAFLFRNYKVFQFTFNREIIGYTDECVSEIHNIQTQEIY